ncbi:MAG: hypothetical protein ACK559_17645, partial [bacterium]
KSNKIRKLFCTALGSFLGKTFMLLEQKRRERLIERETALCQLTSEGEYIANSHDNKKTWSSFHYRGLLLTIVVFF